MQMEWSSRPDFCELFKQIVYGRTQTAFSENGLPIGAGLEDLGKGLRSQVGTMFSTAEKGPRYLELAEKREANESFVYGWIKERVAV